jgi:hypothetical protein
VLIEKKDKVIVTWIGYAKNWATNYFVIVENESCYKNLDHNYTISAWSARELLMVLVQTLTS